MSKKPNLVVERSRNDIEDQVNVTSTSLSDHAFWTPSTEQPNPIVWTIIKPSGTKHKSS